MTQPGHILASKRGLEVFVGLLFYTDAMCDACGYGTRKTSKRWAKCKQCGKRVERRPMPEVSAPPGTNQPEEHA